MGITTLSSDCLLVAPIFEFAFLNIPENRNDDKVRLHVKTDAGIVVLTSPHKSNVLPSAPYLASAILLKPRRYFQVH